MTEEVVVAVLASLLSSFVSSLLTSILTSKLNSYRLDQLEQKVTKHNNLVERVYGLEKNTSTLFNEVEDIRENIRNYHK